MDKNTRGIPVREAKKYIYKITNLINNKCYIGQSICPELLIETNKAPKEIALEANVSTNIVLQINRGKTHKDNNLTYPLNKNN